jgi:hypothetical protein
MHENDAYNYFCYKLFENKNNQIIIKTNLRHIYLNVHLGFNIEGLKLKFTKFEET